MKRIARSGRSRCQRGFSLVEILVSILVLAIGLLGLAGLQSKMLAAEMEAYQRSHALILLEDMMNRIRADEDGARANAYDSIDNDNSNINGWKTALAGKSGDEVVGAMIGAQGCLVSLGTDPKTIRVSVAWQGLSPTALPASGDPCGQDDYGADDTLRRVVSGTVIVLPPEEE